MKFKRVGNYYATDIDWRFLYSLLEVLKIGCVNDGVFCNYKKYTPSEILELLQNSSDIYILKEAREYLSNKDIIRDCLNILVMNLKVRIQDVIDGENTYQILPERLMGRSGNQWQYEISGSPLRLLFFSDPHIGAEEIEDFDKIQAVCYYGKYVLGIDTAFLLGDVFQGVRFDKGPYKGYTYDSPEVVELLESQLDKFQKYFPDFIKVIAIGGNHDKSMNQYLRKKNILGGFANHMFLSLLKPNFHMLIEKSEIENVFVFHVNGINISLSHPLHYNKMYSYVKSYDIEKLRSSDDYYTNFFVGKNDFLCDVMFAGHLHVHINDIIPDFNGVTRRISEVVPSCSILADSTDDHCVALTMRFIKDEMGRTTHYGIMPLYYVDNKIIEGEESIYSTNEELIKNRYKQKKK